MTYGTRIKQAREEMFLTQEQLAEELDISRQAVSKWEADLSRPTRDKLERLSEILNIPPETWAEIDAELAAANALPDSARPWKIATAVLAAVCAVLAVCLAAALWPKTNVDVPRPAEDQRGASTLVPGRRETVRQTASTAHTAASAAVAIFQGREVSGCRAAAAASASISAQVFGGMSKISERRSSFSRVGRERSASHLLTACRLMPSCSASCSWVRRRASRGLLDDGSVGHDEVSSLGVICSEDTGF